MDIIERDNLPEYIELFLTRPKKRGRPSKKDKEVYGKKHILYIPKGTKPEDFVNVLQKEADRLGLPVLIK